MSHARQKIRDAVVTLVTGLTTTGSRVFDTRLYNLEPSEDLPGLVIYKKMNHLKEAILHLITIQEN